MSRTYEQLEPVIHALDERIKSNLGAFPTDTAEGSNASFPDGADGIPLKSLVVNIDPVQDTSSGDPSPENICPISGWTGAKVTRTGKNLFRLGSKASTMSVDGITVIPNSDNTVTVNGTNTGSDNINVQLDFGAWGNTPLSLKRQDTNYKVTYSIKINGTISELIIFFCGYIDKNGGANQSSISNSTLVKTSTIPADAIRLRTWFNIPPGASASNAIIEIQAELGSTATDYEPYQGSTYPITFPTEAGTVYGGTLDVVSGVLTVYPYYARYNGETLTGRWISDRDVYAVGTTPTIGAQVVNIGAEGTEIQLEPHEVRSLLGANNIWADTGDCSVEYRADTKLYIERLTKPDADMIADANIVSGQYFMVGNNLYKATANIASGASVIAGTNATRKSLSEALNEINQ